MPFLCCGDGVELHYAVQGSTGPTVVFLHGLAGHCDEWSGSTQRLAGHFRTIRIDQRGHGLSTRNPVDLSREAFADDVAAVVNDVQAPTPVTLIGQSMGAHTALVVADRHPALVEHLIMVEGDVGGGGPEPLEQVTRAIGAWPPSFACYAAIRDFFGGDTLPGRSWADGYYERDGRWWPRFDPTVVHDVMAPVFMQERWDIWDQLTIRTDLVLGEKGILDADRISRMCTQRPQTGRHTVADAGHDLHLEQPEKWLALLCDLLDD